MGLQKIHGITLIEVLLTLVIAAVLMSIAIPSYKTLSTRNQVVAQSNQLVAAMHLARSEAIKRGLPITLCKGVGNRCVTSGPGWEQGWLVFVDDNANGQRNRGEIVIQKWPESTAKVTIQGSAQVAKRITFNRFGAATGTAGTLTVCGADGNPSHASGINVGTTGRITRAVDGDDADRIVEDAAGNNVSCP